MVYHCLAYVYQNDELSGSFVVWWQPESRSSGLEPVLIAAIPTMKFDQEAFSAEEDAQWVQLSIH